MKFQKSLRWLAQRKIILYSVGFLGILILLAFIIPPRGRITRRTELIVRKAKLRFWHDEVNLFLQREGRLPESLLHLNIRTAYLKVSVPQDFDYDKNYDLMNEPNQLLNEIEYSLAVCTNGWIVMELKPGERYPYRLMIEQDGTISAIREILKHD
jgi:hypothetical protein